MSPTPRPPSTWRARTIWLAPNISSATRPSLRWRGRSVYLAAQAECCCERQKSRKAIICRQRESERATWHAALPFTTGIPDVSPAADEGGIFYVIVKRTTPLRKKIAKGIRILLAEFPPSFSRWDGDRFSDRMTKRMKVGFEFLVKNLGWTNELGNSEVLGYILRPMEVLWST